MSKTALARVEAAEIERLTPEEIAARRFEATLTGITLDAACKSEHSRRAYTRALSDFWTWHRAQGRPVLRKATLQRYAAELAGQGAKAANINQRLSALRRMVKEAAENRLMDEADARSAAAVEGVSAPGRSVGVWLSKGQAEMFINTIDRSTLGGKRDFALICLFLSSGLRRSEMAGLTVEHIQQVEGRWVILGIVGKRNKTRDVPITGWSKHAVDLWRDAAGVNEGVIFRAVNKGDKLAGDSLTPEAIRKIIEREIDRVNDQLATRGASLPRVAAHDLRRTFAQLARKGGSAIEQIQFALGHESIKTTQTYLGGSQDFINAPCDSLGLQVELAR